jgi:hypothetical protein
MAPADQQRWLMNERTLKLGQDGLGLFVGKQIAK